jgi:hypothetical protein
MRAGGLILPDNESPSDRAVRVVLGIGVLSTTMVGPETWWGMVGLVPLITGVIGHCPGYRLLGLSTCPVTTK